MDIFDKIDLIVQFLNEKKIDIKDIKTQWRKKFGTNLDIDKTAEIAEFLLPLMLEKTKNSFKYIELPENIQDIIEEY